MFTSEHVLVIVRCSRSSQIQFSSALLLIIANDSATWLRHAQGTAALTHRIRCPDGSEVLSDSYKQHQYVGGCAARMKTNTRALRVILTWSRQRPVVRAFNQRSPR